jgi:hypothetical protein
MDEVYHYQPLSMTFCLDCHRHPELKLRPLDKITDLDWTPKTPESQQQFGEKAMQQWHIESLQTCSACHR